jgi:tetratricopeptide (TPR) repeat protein
MVLKLGRWQCERREVAEASILADFGVKICDDMSVPTLDSTQSMRDDVQFRQTKFWACKIVISCTMGDDKTAFRYSQLRYQSAQREYQFTNKVTGFQTSTCNTLGQSYAMSGLHDSAVQHLGRSIELRKMMPNFQKDWLYSPLYHLGVASTCVGRLTEAESHLEEAIRDREERFGPNDRESHRTAALYYALGNVRNSQGRTDDAFMLHQRAYVMCRTTVGESALATLKCSQRVAEHYERYDLGTSAR